MSGRPTDLKTRSLVKLVLSVPLGMLLVWVIISVWAMAVEGV